MRIALVLFLLVVNIAAVVLLTYFLQAHAFLIFAALELIAMGVAVSIQSKPTSASYKLAWTMLVVALPVGGMILYVLWGGNVQGKRLNLLPIRPPAGRTAELKRSELSQERLGTALPNWQRASRLLSRRGFLLYRDTAAVYFPTGADFFNDAIARMEKAERFIFLEYFIVDEGVMWGQILEILAKKAAQGVDVRVMYDGTCEFALLPRDYPRRLKKLGIRCKVFAPVTPFVSTCYNYRDHRKILVIDGHTAFNGGVNLADEYINRKVKYGHWKDAAVMLKGEAVRSFTLMFLQMWGIGERKDEYARFLAYDPHPVKGAGGYVVPYGDCPLDGEKVGERVYMDILNRSLSYVHIMTPYLILDGEMETALKFAAERGAEVVLILPGIPDKAVPYALAKTHYMPLLESGVKIYEYTPGFVHAKVFLSDGAEAVVGTINLDYRSLYHHFECATYLYGVSCIREIEEDFQATLLKCRRVTPETVRKEKWTVRLTGRLMKAIAPLM